MSQQFPSDPLYYSAQRVTVEARRFESIINAGRMRVCPSSLAGEPTLSELAFALRYVEAAADQIGRHYADPDIAPLLSGSLHDWTENVLTGAAEVLCTEPLDVRTVVRNLQPVIAQLWGAIVLAVQAAA